MSCLENLFLFIAEYSIVWVYYSVSSHQLKNILDASNLGQLCFGHKYSHEGIYVDISYQIVWVNI